MILRRLASVLRCGVPLIALCCAAPATRAELLGSSFAGVVYDVNPLTGAATNPRPTGTTSLVGITFAPTGTLYGLTTLAGTPANALVTIDPATGATALVGSTGLTIAEGDLGFDPTTGVLYGVQTAGTQRQLFTLNLSTGAGTVVGAVSTTLDLSGLTFDGAGNLYLIAQDIMTEAGDALLRVDRGTAAILSSTPLSVNLGNVVGLAFDPATSTFFVADGGGGGTDNLYTLNPSTGVLTLRGPTGLGDGLAGLAVVPSGGVIPEPSGLVLACVGGATLVAYRKRRWLSR